MSAKPSVRERLSLEFVTADAEVAAMKALLGAAGGLPELVLFDEEAVKERAPEAPVAPVVPATVFDQLEQQENSSEESSFEPGSEDADPVAELRMLFGSVNR